MNESKDTLICDVKALPEYETYEKYVLRSSNWYFEEYKGLDLPEAHAAVENLKILICKDTPISFNNVLIVGSSKTGVSLSPNKCFRTFHDGSDIDIALISSELFHEYWALFRRSYKTQYEKTYSYLYRELYRGFINEKDILAVDGCRRRWLDLVQVTKKNIRQELMIEHEISYRLYRSWDDFEEYNLQSIKQLKRGILKGA